MINRSEHQEYREKSIKRMMVDPVGTDWYPETVPEKSNVIDAVSRFASAQVIKYPSPGTPPKGAA